MKGLKITYWTTTVLISLMMLMSGSMYFASPEVAEGFHKIGFPDFFRVELGIAKILGAIVLLVPITPRIKEWAYFGFLLSFISAIFAHLSIGDTNITMVFVAILLLVTSYITFHKLAKLKTAARA
jgi:uncharacterized membrane protein YphA (DoxX/SURF4 family)